MKKSILNLGKRLDKSQQKSVFGGTELTSPDPNCEGAHDGNGYFGCRCGDGAACTAIIGNTLVGWRPTAGVCQGGSCVA